eukprot:Tamp_03958.p1 GENE.Tamp_03958~~Tamp_03958.p1  ORF type:complete len:823 (+),score=126.30 Tamp_03958:346-2814(+)
MIGSSGWTLLCQTDLSLSSGKASMTLRMKTGGSSSNLLARFHLSSRVMLMHGPNRLLISHSRRRASASSQESIVGAAPCSLASTARISAAGSAGFFMAGGGGGFFTNTCCCGSGGLAALFSDLAMLRVFLLTTPGAWSMRDWTDRCAAPTGRQYQLVSPAPASVFGRIGGRRTQTPSASMRRGLARVPGAAAAGAAEGTTGRRTGTTNINTGMMSASALAVVATHRIIKTASQARVFQARYREEEEERLREAERRAAVSPAGSNASRASRSSQVSRGSKTEKAEQAASRPQTGGQFFVHPLTPMQGDPTATPGLSPMERAVSRRSQRSRPSTQTSLAGTEGFPRSAPGTASGVQSMEIPGTAASSAMLPGTAPATAGVPGSAPQALDGEQILVVGEQAGAGAEGGPATPGAPGTAPAATPEAAGGALTAPGTAGDAGAGPAPGTAGVPASAAASAGADAPHTAGGPATAPDGTPLPATAPGTAGPGTAGAPASAPDGAAQPATAPLTAGAPGLAPDGTALPATAPDAANAQAPGTAGVAPSVPGTAGVPPLSAPQSDFLVLEDEGELEPLVDLAGGEAGLSSIISSVLSSTVDVVGTEIQESAHPAPSLPDQVPPLPSEARSRPQTRGSVSGSIMSQMSDATEQGREDLANIGGRAEDMVSGVLSGVAGDFPDSMPSTRPGTSATGARDEPPTTPLSHPQTPAGSAPPTPGPIAPQASMEDEDTAAHSRHTSRAPTANQSINEGTDVLDTEEGQYGSRPQTGPSAQEIAAREEEERERLAEARRQEEEMARQVQEMREELARVYESDLVTFFDLYLALSQPV